MFRKVINTTLLKSADGTLNWIFQLPKGSLETRILRRHPEYISATLSSHSGCTMGCKFCHLTELKQTSFQHCTVDDYAMQLQTIMDYVNTIDNSEIKRVNLNYMSRGECLANKTILNDFKLWHSTAEQIIGKKYKIKHNISTIFPNTMRDRELKDVFQDIPVAIYYSMYSTNPEFRKYWIPNAIDYKLALDKLNNYYSIHDIPFTFHWPIIKDHNDSIEDAEHLRDTLKSYDFNAKFNLIRFNSPNDNYKEASYDRIQQVFSIINDGLNNNPRSKIVTRLGHDVKASCGMFVVDK